MLKKNNIVILTGPTGVGKTNISIRIAKYIPEIEIISADSMQIYKDLNIGTDKPDISILKKYPHHCIDIVSPIKNYDVMQYFNYSHKCIKNILSRNKKPLIVGGTGLYLKSFIEPIFDGPGKNTNIRANLTKIAADKGNNFLYDELKKIDAEYSAKISKNDIKRIIRGLEVYYLTGHKLSYFHHKSKDNVYQNKPNYNFYIICLFMKREKMYQKINERVEEMIKKGLIDETKNIINKYKKENINFKQCTAMQGLGYKQLLLHLRGYISLNEAIETIKKETRHFSKRQLSWFRNQISVDYWINIDEYKNLEECSKKIINIIKSMGY